MTNWNETKRRVFLLIGVTVALPACAGPFGLRERLIEKRERQTMEARDRQPAAGNNQTEAHVTVGGTMRNYQYHVPEGGEESKPLLLVFHGGHGDVGKMWVTGNFKAKADRYGFAVALPVAIDGHWRDGRNSTGGDDPADLEFTRAVIADMSRRTKIDRNRIYATGASNGGIFVLRLACDMSKEIAAFGPVIASFPEDYVGRCRPGRPVPINIINGRDDQLIKWDGGEIPSRGKAGAGGRVVPVPQTVEFWRRNNSCAANPPAEHLPDLDTTDGTRVSIFRYLDCAKGSALEQVRIDGGGHTWPGSPVTPALRISGKVSHDIDGTDHLWNFFSRFRLP